MDCIADDGRCGSGVEPDRIVDEVGRADGAGLYRRPFTRRRVFACCRSALSKNMVRTCRWAQT